MKLRNTLWAGMALAAMLAGDAKAVFVRTAPPPPRSTAVIGRAPGAGWVWTPGFYTWGGRRYVWTPGRWRRPPHRGAVWVSPVWRRGPGGWTFVAGRWR